MAYSAHAPLSQHYRYVTSISLVKQGEKGTHICGPTISKMGRSCRACASAADMIPWPCKVQILDETRSQIRPKLAIHPIHLEFYTLEGCPYMSTSTIDHRGGSIDNDRADECPCSWNLLIILGCNEFKSITRRSSEVILSICIAWFPSIV